MLCLSEHLFYSESLNIKKKKKINQSCPRHRIGCSATGLDRSGFEIPSPSPLSSTLQLFLPSKYFILGILVYFADLGHFLEILIFDSFRKEEVGMNNLKI